MDLLVLEFARSMRQTFSFEANRLCVLQSVPLGDLEIGRQVYDTCQYRMRAEWFDLPGRREFLDHLAALQVGASDAGWMPLLHIDCHGNREGLQFRDESFITWPEVSGALTRINITTKLNLVAVLSACCGAYLRDILKPGCRAPVLAVIGPSTDIKAGDALDGLISFYAALMRGNDLASALGTLVEKAPAFRFLDAPSLYRRIRRRYLSIKRPDIDRAKAIADQLRMEVPSIPVSDEELRRGALRIVRSGRAERQIIEHFFMADLFPEHSSRFVEWVMSTPGDDCLVSAVPES